MLKTAVLQSKERQFWKRGTFRNVFNVRNHFDVILVWPKSDKVPLACLEQHVVLVTKIWNMNYLLSELYFSPDRYFLAKQNVSACIFHKLAKSSEDWKQKIPGNAKKYPKKGPKMVKVQLNTVSNVSRTIQIPRLSRHEISV